MPVVKKQRFRKQSNNGGLRKHVDLSSVGFEDLDDGNTNYPVSIDATPKSFSFKNNLADNEFVQNPNIFETQDYSRIKNMPLDMVDKFDNQDDPFFDFDEQRPAFESGPFSQTFESGPFSQTFQSGPFSSNVIQKQTIKKVARKMSSTSVARSPKSKTYGVK